MKILPDVPKSLKELLLGKAKASNKAVVEAKGSLADARGAFPEVERHMNGLKRELDRFLELLPPGHNATQTAESMRRQLDGLERNRNRIKTYLRG